MAVEIDLKGSFKGDIDIDVDVEVDVDIDSYLGCLNGGFAWKLIKGPILRMVVSKGARSTSMFIWKESIWY